MTQSVIGHGEHDRFKHVQYFACVGQLALQPVNSRRTAEACMHELQCYQLCVAWLCMWKLFLTPASVHAAGLSSVQNT